MLRFLKVIHLLGLAIFVGSIFGHILLGHLGDPATDIRGFSAFMQAKYVNVIVLTTSGLLLLVISGVMLVLGRAISPLKQRWMLVKISLVCLIALNGIFILTPLSSSMAEIAQSMDSSGKLPESFMTLKQREDLFGALNMVMILTVMSLSVSRLPFKKYPNSPITAKGQNDI